MFDLYFVFIVQVKKIYKYRYFIKVYKYSLQKNLLLFLK